MARAVTTEQDGFAIGASASSSVRVSMGPVLTASRPVDVGAVGSPNKRNSCLKNSIYISRGGVVRTLQTLLLLLLGLHSIGLPRRRGKNKESTPSGRCGGSQSLTAHFIVQHLLQLQHVQGSYRLELRLQGMFQTSGMSCELQLYMEHIIVESRETRTMGLIHYSWLRNSLPAIALDDAGKVWPVPGIPINFHAMVNAEARAQGTLSFRSGMFLIQDGVVGSRRWAD